MVKTHHFWFRSCVVRCRKKTPKTRFGVFWASGSLQKYRQTDRQTDMTAVTLSPQATDVQASAAAQRSWTPVLSRYTRSSSAFPDWPTVRHLQWCTDARFWPLCQSRKKQAGFHIWQQQDGWISYIIHPFLGLSVCYSFEQFPQIQSTQDAETACSCLGLWTF